MHLKPHPAFIYALAYCCGQRLHCTIQSFLTKQNPLTAFSQLFIAIVPQYRRSAKAGIRAHTHMRTCKNYGGFHRKSTGGPKVRSEDVVVVNIARCFRRLFSSTGSRKTTHTYGSCSRLSQWQTAKISHQAHTRTLEAVRIPSASFPFHRCAFPAHYY